MQSLQSWEEERACEAKGQQCATLGDCEFPAAIPNSNTLHCTLRLSTKVGGGPVKVHSSPPATGETLSVCPPGFKFSVRTLSNTHNNQQTLLNGQKKKTAQTSISIALHLFSRMQDITINSWDVFTGVCVLFFFMHFKAV